MESKIPLCCNCLGEIEERNGNFELELCNSCNQVLLEEEGM